MDRRHLGLLPLLLLSTAHAQYVDTTASVAIPPGLRHQIGLASTLLLPRNSLWYGESLTCEARSLGTPTIGGEYVLRRTPTWLFGISLGTTRVYTDAIHMRSTSHSSNTELTVYGERMGLDQRFTSVGVTAAYEPWHFPRRHKVGMTVQVGGGLSYMHFSEQRYAVANGQANAMNYSGRTFYTYATHDDMEVLGHNKGHGISAMLWLRPELHFGRRVALFWDLGAVFATPFNADGSTYSTVQGTTLTIAPRSVHLHRFMLRSGLAVYF
ncbi:MAG: hypothetical protein ABI432_06880 [Flavobacteriales bacterium]